MRSKSVSELALICGYYGYILWMLVAWPIHFLIDMKRAIWRERDPSELFQCAAIFGDVAFVSLGIWLIRHGGHDWRWVFVLLLIHMLAGFKVISVAENLKHEFTLTPRGLI